MPLFTWNKMCQSTARLDGKTVIVTGANTGIGKETARDMFMRGARVIMACRDLSRAEEAAKDVRNEDPGRSADVVIRKLDLASLQSVRKCAEEINDTEPFIHILINNAGVMLCPQTKTEDGFEMQIGINHLGHFLLTNLLLDKIKASAPARIINVSSLAHAYGKIHFDDLFLEKSYGASKAYGQSKLANVLFTVQLAKRLEGTGVSVYALHPGAVDTELLRYSNQTLPSLIPWFLKKTAHIFFKSPKQGAQTTIYCAVSEELQNQSGLYYSDCAVKEPSSRAKNVEDAQKLWEISCNLVDFEDTQKKDSH